MLESMRQNTKSLQVFFWLVIAAFIAAPLAGVIRSGFGKSGSQNAAAWVNGEPISFISLEQGYRNLYNFYRQIYGENLTQDVLKNLQLEQAALDQLVEKSLLVQAAREYGLQVSEQELVQAIKDIPQFQQNGRFDPEIYTGLLAQNRMTPQDFEIRMTEDLLVQKIEHLIKQTVQVSEQEVRVDYAAENEKVQVEGIAVHPASFLDQIEVTDEEIAAHYDAHKESFTTPPRIKIRYMAFDPAQFAEDVVVSEEQIRQYYESRESEFNKGKEVKARHILLRVPDDADADVEAEITKKAADIVQLLKDGADFAELAVLHSEDPGSAEQGGDLGFFTKGMMVPEFEEAAFALEPGEFSELVRSQFGYHIIQVDEVREDADPYATAKPIIEDRLKLEQAKTLAEEQADVAYQQALDSRDFQQVAEGTGVEIQESQFFAQGEPIDDNLSVNWQIQNVAFTLNTDERFSPPIETTTGFYVIEFLESQEPYIPELEEITDNVTEALRQEKARELAQAKAQEIKDALDAGADWATVVEEESVELLTPAPFSRRQQYITEFPGDTENVIKTAFALQAEENSAPLDLSDQYVIIRLVEKLGIDDAAFVEEKDTLTQSVLAQKQNTVFDEFVDELRQQADILVSELLQG